MRTRSLAVACCLLACAKAEPPVSVHFTVDVAKDRHPISRYIYGVNHPLEGAYANLPFCRIGGNRLTAYNWVNNASNAGNDWHYQNDAYLGGGDVPGGALVSTLQKADALGAGTVLTIPMAGYVSADKKPGGDVRESGTDYLQSRFRKSEPSKRAGFTLKPDPKSPVVYQDEFVNWVKTTFPRGVSDPKRPIFYALDNEPDLWQSTHPEIHPANPTYEEMVARTIAYSRAIKKVVPGAKIFGPVNYGWQGMVHLQNAPDANGRDFQEVYLEEMAKEERADGQRLIDVLDVHWYPEARGGDKRVAGEETTPEVVEARVQAPRSLWDPGYTEVSWITKSSTKGPIALLPRLQSKIDRLYPGTQLALTEYNFGGGSHISGAIAQADVLGILGRANLFAACLWPLAKDESFIEAAFQMFLNFDGHNSKFGDVSVSAQTDDVADTSIYASVDSANPKRLVLVAINKTSAPIACVVEIKGFGQAADGTIYGLEGGKKGPHPMGTLGKRPDGNWGCVLAPQSVSTIAFAAR